MDQPTQAATVVSTKSAEHYRWAGEGQIESDAWYLLRSPGMHVIEERMPPGTREMRHFHAQARQFFYVLEGELTMEIERQHFLVKQYEGVEIAPTRHHQAVNRSDTPVRFLVISQPPSHGDRTESPEATV